MYTIPNHQTIVLFNPPQKTAENQLTLPKHFTSSKMFVMVKRQPKCASFGIKTWLVLINDPEYSRYDEFRIFHRAFCKNVRWSTCSVRASTTGQVLNGVLIHFLRITIFFPVRRREKSLFKICKCYFNYAIPPPAGFFFHTFFCSYT